MEPKKIPASLAVALSLVVQQGCVFVQACLSVVKDDLHDTGETGSDTGTGPCLTMVVHSGVSPCLIPPLDHTGQGRDSGGHTGSGGHSGSAGTGDTGHTGGAAAAVDRDDVLERLPPDVRARLDR